MLWAAWMCFAGALNAAMTYLWLDAGPPQDPRRVPSVVQSLTKITGWPQSSYKYLDTFLTTADIANENIVGNIVVTTSPFPDRWMDIKPFLMLLGRSGLAARIEDTEYFNHLLRICTLRENVNALFALTTCRDFSEPWKKRWSGSSLNSPDSTKRVLLFARLLIIESHGWWTGTAGRG